MLMVNVLHQQIIMEEQLHHLQQQTQQTTCPDGSTPVATGNCTPMANQNLKESSRPDNQEQSSSNNGNSPSEHHHRKSKD